MKKSILIPLISVAFLIGCTNNAKCKETSEPKLGGDEVVLPDEFRNTNFCNGAVEYYSGGLALIFDEKNNPDIQNISFELEFYSIQFDRLPMKKDGSMYFLPFKVTDQIIDDGYLKNGQEYKFWLSYTNSSFFCGISANDDTLTQPTATLVEGLM